MSKIEYWLWLSSADRVSIRSKAAVLEYYGDAELAYNARKGEFRTIHGVSEKDARELEKRDLSFVADIIASCKMSGIDIVTMDDERYPARLRNVFAPPAVIYVKGKLPPVDTRAVIAVVGTRAATAYGLKMSRKLGYEITKCGGTVVSGITAGIDSEALTAALDAGGCCIGVLGVPMELEHSPLSERIAAQGALISEYAPGTKPFKSFFRERNRITSGLSLGVVAVEAPEKSGTALFIAEAAEQGKEVFAVPGNADSENSKGTNGFIRDGAKPVTCGWDILCEFEGRWRVENVRCDIPKETEETQTAPSVRKKASKPAAKKAIDKENVPIYIEEPKTAPELPEDQRRIMAVLLPGGTLVDDIIAATGLTTARVLSQLTVLEIKGLIRRLPGRLIAPVNTAKK